MFNSQIHTIPKTLLIQLEMFSLDDISFWFLMYRNSLSNTDSLTEKAA